MLRGKATDVGWWGPEGGARWGGRPSKPLLLWLPQQGALKLKKVPIRWQGTLVFLKAQGQSLLGALGLLAGLQSGWGRACLPTQR